MKCLTTRRKEQAVVEAVQFRPPVDGYSDICRMANWLAQQQANLGGWLFHDTDITVPTDKGPRVIKPGDWLVKEGDVIRPVKFHIFHRNFEPTPINSVGRRPSK